MASSLEEICLEVIVEEFERIHFVFRVTNNEAHLRNFEFLRRKFSSELVSKLSNKRKMKDDYMEFLINKYVKYLHNDFFKNSSCPVKDTFCHLSNLTEVFFGGYCSDEILENIAKFCPKLVLIDATFSPVTDIGVTYLCKDVYGKVPCPELKILGIRCTRVTDEGVKYLLQNLPSLEILDWTDVPKILCFLYEASLLKFTKVENVYSYNLIELNLLSLYYRDRYTDLLKICLTVCPKLKSVACCITDKEQLTLFNNTSLEKLKLRFLKSAPNTDISNFLRSNGSNLVYLNIFKCTMSISYLTVSCPKLKELHMKDVTFLDDDDEDDSQPVFDCLFKCVFNNIKDDSTAIKAICFILLSSPKLEVISFRFCILSIYSRTRILNWCENHPLKVITFEGVAEMSFVTDILLRCRFLLSLYLISCQFSDHDEKELKNLIETLPNKPRIIRNSCENENFLPGTVAGRAYFYPSL